MDTNPNGRTQRTEIDSGSGQFRDQRFREITRKVDLTNAERQGAECLTKRQTGLSGGREVTLWVTADKNTEMIEAFIRSRFLLRQATGGEPE